MTTKFPQGVTCPSCHGAALPTMTSWGMRHDCCGLHSWHGTPLVSQATHDARQEAHNYFDPLWHHGRMTRSDAYKVLAGEMRIPARDCHISRMTEEQARSVKDHVARIWKQEKEKEHG